MTNQYVSLLLMLVAICWNPEVAHSSVLTATDACALTYTQQEQIRHSLSDPSSIVWAYLKKATDPRAYSVNLYNIQLVTSSLLEYIDICKDREIAVSLMPYIEIAFQNLSVRLGETLWTDKTYLNNSDEVLLYSTQFLYALARLYRISLDLKLDDAVARSFQERTGTFLSYTYLRWIRTPSMWIWPECIATNPSRAYNYREYIDRKYTQTLQTRSGGLPSHCNMVLDIDLWIGGGITEFLEAEASKIGKGALLSSLESNELQGLAQMVLDVFESRLEFPKFSQSPLYDTKKLCNDCELVRLDQPQMYKYWKGGGDPSQRSDAWDISHARRISLYSRTVYLHSSLVTSKLASGKFLKAFANTLALEVLKGTNLKYPNISDYINGSNSLFGAGVSFSYFDSDYGFFSEFSPLLSVRHLEMLNEFTRIIARDPDNIKYPIIPSSGLQGHRSWRDHRYWMFVASLSGNPTLKKENRAQLISEQLGSYYLLGY